ncbi:YeaH [Klebsiella michiganensis]|uniref:YeaH n=1 Tax=Klebsiella michiganensis TaxID=1134687 RepID=A0A7H4LUS2_9ENTR|nr:YeaH [Klebsiella michiganensis]
MTWFIDRRLNGKNKSAVNRQRFLRRYKAQIKQSISEAINKRSVTDIQSGESVSIPNGRY